MGDVIEIKSHIKGVSKFQYFRDGAFWYKTDTEFLFPVPVSEMEGVTVEPEYKSIYLMRWIRKYAAEIHT